MDKTFNQLLRNQSASKESKLCIGLDIDPDRFPLDRDTSLNGMETFAKDLIDGTIAFCPVYKPNFAF